MFSKLPSQNSYLPWIYPTFSLKWNDPPSAHTKCKGIYFVNTDLHFSPGWLLFSSPTDFMIYSILQGLTQHSAGALLPIYCMEHLRETPPPPQQQIPNTTFSSWRGRRAGANASSSPPPPPPAATNFHLQILIFFFLGQQLPCCASHMGWLCPREILSWLLLLIS